VYAQNRIFATTLALIGIWEQLVLCNCAERDTAVEDLAHSFTMVCLLSRSVLCFLGRLYAHNVSLEPPLLLLVRPL
jgi:hypothetical protein